jgi:hypothetical protein
MIGRHYVAKNGTTSMVAALPANPAPCGKNRSIDGADSSRILPESRRSWSGRPPDGYLRRFGDVEKRVPNSPASSDQMTTPSSGGYDCLTRVDNRRVREIKMGFDELLGLLTRRAVATIRVNAALWTCFGAFQLSRLCRMHNRRSQGQIDAREESLDGTLRCGAVVSRGPFYESCGNKRHPNQS